MSKGVRCRVEAIPHHAMATMEVELSRVPCIGERLYTEDQVFLVRHVYHPISKGELPIVRVQLS